MKTSGVLTIPHWERELDWHIKLHGDDMAVYLAGTNRAVEMGNTYFPEISVLGIQGSGIANEKMAERVRIAKLKQDNGIPLKARINHARWIVDCPNCGSAEFAFEDNLFLCSQCGNGDIGGKVRKVAMPTERTRIESLLSQRKIINRHWLPTETITDLREENFKMEIK